ncbi:hypothetical protein BDN72DRAFT_347914 [Pluteus cervinus]|uniref:Uncharacterized protein n=1 Tax=Pluteus cervinus TaxID=181527 RepID=A0ACD3AAX3_9AGAR|nr:hypothetical protein BDN72DRAFT_347914 [Pluteus cervinus]
MSAAGGSNAPASPLEEIAEVFHGNDGDSYYLSKKFRSSDADVTFQSIDKVKFHVYKKDLATFSGGFPPAELVSSDLEIIDLPEGAVVLDIVFSFTRPQRYPDIHDLKIETLFELALISVARPLRHICSSAMHIQKIGYFIPSNIQEFFRKARKFSTFL